MQYEWAARKLRRSGYKLATANVFGCQVSIRATREHDRYAIDLSVCDGEVTRMKVISQGEESDSRSDYFPGWDAPSLKKAMAYADESSRQWRERHEQALAAIA